jgi:hypothetical protein
VEKYESDNTGTETVMNNTVTSWVNPDKSDMTGKEEHI